MVVLKDARNFPFKKVTFLMINSARLLLGPSPNWETRVPRFRKAERRACPSDVLGSCVAKFTEVVKMW